MAGEDVPAYPALRRIGVAVGRVLDHDHDHRLRDLVHWPLSALTVRDAEPEQAATTPGFALTRPT
jgi:hypothetical protein